MIEAALADCRVRLPAAMALQRCWDSSFDIGIENQAARDRQKQVRLGERHGISLADCNYRASRAHPSLDAGCNRRYSFTRTGFDGTLSHALHVPGDRQRVPVGSLNHATCLHSAASRRRAHPAS